MDNTLKESYLSQRRVIGWLGIFLPVLCVASEVFIEDKPDGWWYSISATYHFSPVLTMMMSCTALFLMTYKGYDTGDRIINCISGILALCVVLFPCNTEFLDQETKIGLFQLLPTRSHIVHCVSAAFLFVSFAVNILVQFTKGNHRKQNIIYKTCGWLMVVCMVLYVLTEVMKIFPGYSTIFFEGVLLLLFGTAWLVKGKFIALEDDEAETESK